MTQKEKTKREFKFNFKVSNAWELITFEGRPHLKVAVVMALGDSVMNGALYPSYELKQSAEEWNGKPVVIYHPNDNGEDVTANTPDKADYQRIGAVYDVVFNDGKLKGFAYIDTELASRNPKGLEIVRRVKQNDIIEMSIGVFSYSIEEDGIANKKEYREKVYGVRPDHLAVLPDQKGALSVKDGGGLNRFNSEKDLNNNQHKKGESLKMLKKMIANHSVTEAESVCLEGADNSVLTIIDEKHKENGKLKANADVLAKQIEADAKVIAELKEFKANVEKVELEKISKTVSAHFNMKQETVDALPVESIKALFNDAKEAKENTDEEDSTYVGRMMVNSDDSITDDDVPDMTNFNSK